MLIYIELLMILSLLLILTLFQVFVRGVQIQIGDSYARRDGSFRVESTLELFVSSKWEDDNLLSMGIYVKLNLWFV